MPSYQRTSDDLPVEQQPVWQIERIDTLATPIGEQTEPGQETQYSYKTRRMYPNGIEDYRWCMSQATEYDYDYRH